MHLTAQFDIPFGILEVCFDETFIFATRILTTRTIPHKNSASCDKLAIELQRFFNKPNSVLSYTLSPKGTPFQTRVWQALRNIPYGETITYSMLAQQQQTHARAIGQACRCNPIPLLIPCHRVIAKNSLGGFMGADKATSLKRMLLQHEGVSV